MLHDFKTTALFAACLVLATACSSDTTSPLNALAVDTESSDEVAASVSAPKATPVNLALLDRLANEAGTTLAQSIQTKDPAGAIPTTWAVPAASVTYETNTPLSLDTDVEYNSESLIVVPHDSDLLNGTAYESGAESSIRKPVMTPGTFRTIEYKG